MNKKENIQPDPNKCNQFTDECNKLRLENEILNNMELEENPTEFEYLYPTLNDPNFNIKIAKKQEFNDTKYDGHIYDVKEYANILSAMEFELSPHQAFVRNFMSFQTPYKSYPIADSDNADWYCNGNPGNTDSSLEPSVPPR